jgi:V8-like Glu-specific endopeptidase
MSQRVIDVKRLQLERLYEDYEAASNQWSNVLSEVDRIRLQRALEKLLAEIHNLESELGSTHLIEKYDMNSQSSSDPLTIEERNRLAYEIVAGLSDFTDFDIRGRRELLVAAELGKFLPGMVWSGSDRIVAASLVDRLNGHGFLEERPNYHAIGALMAYLLKHPDVKSSDKEFMAGLLIRKALIRDPFYIEGLRKTYGITDEQPYQPQPTHVSRKAMPAEQMRQPTFIPVIQDKEGLEEARNSETNLLDIIQLLGALYSAEAVGRVEFSLEEPIGTGWLIGPDLLLTNQHVLPDKERVEAAKVRFGYRQDRLGVIATEGREYSFDPDVYYTSPVEKLDYALVRLTKPPLADMKVDDETKGLSWFDLIRQGKHRGYLLYATRNVTNLERVNMIQHPGGTPQKVALTQNFVTNTSDTRIHYTTDTLRGSSGSPVFTRLWEVIALHHSGVPIPPMPGIMDINEGIPMKAILKDFERQKTEDGRPLLSLLPKLQ